MLTITLCGVQLKVVDYVRHLGNLTTSGSKVEAGRNYVTNEESHAAYSNLWHL